MKITISEMPQIYSMMFCSPAVRHQVIEAAISSRDISKNMVRCKSSNVWSRTINVKRHGDNKGDVYVQFKGKNGGPGDVYVLYDVPIRLYRQWLTAPSVGHFYWVNLRNNYAYSKLTGDKRGKLKNAVNR